MKKTIDGDDMLDSQFIVLWCAMISASVTKVKYSDVSREIKALYDKMPAGSTVSDMNLTVALRVVEIQRPLN